MVDYSVVSLDFETKSRADLKTVGTDNYASHLTTDILCCSFIHTLNGVEADRWLWFAESGDLPYDIYDALRYADEVQAQNARFDQLIYEYVGVEDYEFPELDINVWTCSSAQARLNAMPADLDGMSRAADAKFKKDHKGKALIRALSIPVKSSGEFNQDPTLMGEMGKYCMDDSVAMVSATGLMRPMSDMEKSDWLISERINDRGMKVDLELARYAERYASAEKEELGARLSELTDGAVTKVTQSARLVKFLKEEFEGEREYLNILKRVNKDGDVKYSADKTSRAELLAKPELDDFTRSVVEAYDQGSNSSVSKFSAMLLRADPETQRVYGAFIFAGAGQTSRYSSKGLQVHNFRRDVWTADEAEELKHHMKMGCDITALSNISVMDTLAKLLRPAIIPEEGHSFVVSDWSAIEARVLPWLSDSAGGEKVLDIFRDGRDIYVETANDMKMDDRQTGKVAVLSLGFGGAVGALQAMCKNYGVAMSDAAAQIVVDRWRRANVWAINFWNALEAATIRALRAPNKVQKAGRLRYVFAPNILGGTLLCILPDDSVIQYPYARLDKGGVTCMKASIKPAADSNDEWPRMRLWGGFLAENVTQSTAAALLKAALRACDKARLPVVGHIHDEIILEVPDDEAADAVVRLQNIMESCPSFAEGLILHAQPATMKRFGK